MYAVEFETEIKDRFIEIPEYDSFKNKHAKVILMTDTKNTSQPSSIVKENDLMEEIFSEAQTLYLDESINVDQIMQDMNDGLC